MSFVRLSISFACAERMRPTPSFLRDVDETVIDGPEQVSDVVAPQSVTLCNTHATCDVQVQPGSRTRDHPGRCGKKTSADDVRVDAWVVPSRSGLSRR